MFTSRLETFKPNLAFVFNFQENHEIQFNKREASYHKKSQDVRETECCDGIDMDTWVLYRVFCHTQIYILDR